MTRQSRPWFRVYGEVLDDRKLARTAKMTKQPRALILGVWIGLLALSNESPIRGRLQLTESAPLSLEEMADGVGIDEMSMISIVAEFIALNMLAWDGDTLVISHWDGRQFESDSSTDRVRAWREKQEEPDETPEPDTDETLQKQPDNVSVTLSETESESEGEAPARDYIDDLLAGAGNGAGVADPSQDKHARYQYRDKALKVYHDLTDLFPDRQVGKPAIVKLTRESDFDLDRWQRSIESCKLNGVNPHNIACIIDTYRAGGDYRAMLDGRKAGNGAPPGQRAGPVVVVNESGQRTMVVK